MNYELALELKNAGFPQTKEWGLIGGGKWLPPQNLMEYVNPVTAGAYAPTLSELIEACGAQFESLHSGTNWFCNDTLLYEGPTPEEAVARLYLALNENI